jgi:hypothetical protein
MDWPHALAYTGLALALPSLIIAGIYLVEKVSVKTKSKLPRAP